VNAYPSNWDEIAKTVKDAAGWRCVRCKHAHNRVGWRILTVHHLDGDKSNCAWWNLPALCQRCHLTIQARVVLKQVWPFEHTEWFRPYAAGWYAWKYLRVHLTRDEVMERLNELLALERIA
jgi:hypothetical protein